MKPDPDTHMPLALLCRELKQRAVEANANSAALAGLTHRRVSNAALDATIPAERINGRWYVKKADLPKIAELFGIMPKPRIGRPPRRQDPSNMATMAA
jgi:hypothetical protein